MAEGWDSKLYQDMSEVIPNLWLGNLNNATDADLLKSKNIHSILSVMRGKVRIAETFKRYQIELDDTEQEDVLKHLVTAITFLQNELDNNRGVLVHCLAGISRSVTIVAAYLMYAKGLDPAAALDLVRDARPFVDPNPSFLNQLDIFHQASYKVSKHDKAVRMFYLERMVKEVINGEGSVDSTMLPNFPRTPSASAPATPSVPRRRIRCKMCRTELASREHMLDHGQLGPPTPAVSYSPVVTSPPAFPVLTMSSELSSPKSSEPGEGRLTPAEVDEAEELGREMSRSMSLAEEKDVVEKSAMDEHGASPPSTAEGPVATERPGISAVVAPPARPPASSPSSRSQLSSSGFAHPSELSAQFYSNPQLAALRGGLSVVPEPSPSLSLGYLHAEYSPPILANPKCSGYFVEPMKWMEPFLEQGDLAGKIICPNKKCNAKLGNYDWAGVCCSCKEWVVPGFCIHRSKVDEIV